MAIYELFEKEHAEDVLEEVRHASEEKIGKHFFSTLVTRFCFLLLFFADSAWLVYNTCLMILFAAAHLLTGRKVAWIGRMLGKFALNFRRSVVCGLSLLIGLFSPPFGIMVACTYFLMYDKAGMEEVVPAPLQSNRSRWRHRSRTATCSPPGRRESRRRPRWAARRDCPRSSP